MNSVKQQILANLAQRVRDWVNRALPIHDELRRDDVVFDPLEIIGDRNLQISRLSHDLEELRADVLRGFKIAHEVTLETQSVEEACATLVQLVRQARMQRDDLWNQLVAKGKSPVQP